MQRIWNWVSRIATVQVVISWIAYVVGAITVSNVLAWATLATIGMWGVIGICLLCRRIPVFRDWKKADQFKALAPELEEALSGTEGLVSARVHNRENEELANRAYSRVNVLLTRLKFEFGISVPEDPYDLVLLKPNHKLFARIVAYAHAGNLTEARKISGWRPWPGTDDGPQPIELEP